jgi:SAM-dependent methyltransferase
MRRFDAEYLASTRRGMWERREALSGLDLGARERILDIGCGTGELSRVLAEESPGDVVGIDADLSLLSRARDRVPVLAGDARRLPFPDGTFDLVVCQALLINLPNPGTSLREFRRVSSDLVCAIEPDNGAVEIDSTVEEEESLERRSRARYIDGVETDVTLGSDTRTLFEAAALSAIETTRYDHVKRIEPPYDGHALEAVRRKATGAGLDSDRETLLSGALTEEGFDDLRERWRAVGHEAAAQMREGTYRRVETVPFYVTVGRV